MATASPVFFAGLTTVAPGVDGQLLQVKGYAAVGDGGEGIFQWASGDNRGTPTGSSAGLGSDGGTYSPGTNGGGSAGRWARINPTARYRAEWFGACVGIADCTTAINNAILALKAINGGVLSFGVGAFTHAGTLNGCNGLVLEGLGPLVTILRHTAVGKQLSFTNSVNASNQGSWIIRNLTLDDTAWPSVAAVPLGATATSGVTYKPTRDSPRALLCTTTGTMGSFESIGQLLPQPVAALGVTPPPAVTCSGTPTGDHAVDVLITTGGVLGSGMQYSVILDGTTIATAQTGATYVVTGTGITVTLAAGTYPVNTLYKTSAFRWSFYQGTSITNGTAVFQVIDASDAVTDLGSSLVKIENVETTARSHAHDFVLDQTETFLAEGWCYLNGHIGAWLVNGSQHLPNNNPEIAETFTNVLKLANVEFNNDIGIVHDGGVALLVDGCNFNCTTFAMVSCSADAVNVRGGDYEGFTSTYTGPGWATGQRAIFKLNATDFYGRISNAPNEAFVVGPGCQFSAGTAYIADLVDGNGGTTVGDFQIAPGNSIACAAAALVHGGGSVVGPLVDSSSNNTPGVPLLDAAPVFGILISRNDWGLKQGTVQVGGVGLGSLTKPRAGLDLATTLAIRPVFPVGGAGVIVNGTNNNVALYALAYNATSYWEVTGLTAPTVITGIAAPTTSGGEIVDGFDLFISFYGNGNNNPITLSHENGGSTAANQIWSPLGSDLVLLPPNGGFATAHLKYSKTAGFWLVVSWSPLSGDLHVNHAASPVTCLQNIVYVVDASAGAVTLNLPVVGLNQWVEVLSDPTVASNSGITVNAGTGQTLQQQGSATFATSNTQISTVGYGSLRWYNKPGTSAVGGKTALVLD